MIFVNYRVFFDACDGIFLNYWWSKNTLKNSVKNAGPDRQADVYVGVDVFGRGCLGGGGYNSKAVCRYNNMFIVWMLVLDFLCDCEAVH